MYLLEKRETYKNLLHELDPETNLCKDIDECMIEPQLCFLNETQRYCVNRFNGYDCDDQANSRPTCEDFSISNDYELSSFDSYQLILPENIEKRHEWYHPSEIFTKSSFRNYPDKEDPKWPEYINKNNCLKKEDYWVLFCNFLSLDKKIISVHIYF